MDKNQTPNPKPPTQPKPPTHPKPPPKPKSPGIQYVKEGQDPRKVRMKKKGF